MLNLNINFTEKQKKELELDNETLKQLNNKFEDLVCDIKNKIINAGQRGKIYERELENFVKYLNGIIRNRMTKGIDELAATEDVLIRFDKYLQDFRMGIIRKKVKQNKRYF